MENKTCTDLESSGQTANCCGASLTRREALIMAASASVLALLPLYKASADTPDQWVTVGKRSDFTANLPVLTAPAPTEAVYVTRIDDKTLVAVSAKCTHHGCQVAWTPADKQFECPCHGAAFAVTGKNNSGTRRQPTVPLPPLLSLPVRQDGDHVQVNLAGIAPDILQPRHANPPAGAPGGPPAT